MTRDYAERRARWEPLLEVTQAKGDSEARIPCFRRKTSSRTSRPGTKAIRLENFFFCESEFSIRLQHPLFIELKFIRYAQVGG